jgi:flagellar motor switch protein FliM
VNRQLSQQEIDAVFENLEDRKGSPAAARKGLRFDFRRLDRIAKSQMRAIHMLHENFVRNLGSSLSAYLRSYLTVNLVSVEQLSYAEFLEGLPSPTCIASLGLPPYEGNAALEVNPSIIFPILEMMLGGNGKSPAVVQREITEIEQNLLDGLFRIILHDLAEAWKSVTVIDFKIENMEKEPQLLQIVAPNEAVVAVGVEIRVGDSTGMMNMAMPAIIIKMMRQKFEQQWSVRKAESTETEQERMLRFLKSASVELDGRLEGATLSLEDLLALEEGDLLTFDHPLGRSFDCQVNGKLKYKGQVVRLGNKKGFRIERSA